MSSVNGTETAGIGGIEGGWELSKRTLALVFLLGLASCSDTSASDTGDIPGDANPRSEDVDSVPATHAETSIWTVSEEVDPLTDDTVLKATTDYEIGPFVVRTAVTCNGASRLKYEFLAYDENQNGASFVSRNLAPLGMNIDVTYYEIRLDKQERETWNFSGADYTNQLAIMSEEATRAGRSDKIAIKLPLKTGKPVIEIDQSDAQLRKVLDTCLADSPSAPVAATETTGNPGGSEDAGLIEAADQSGGEPSQSESSDGQAASEDAPPAQ